MKRFVLPTLLLVAVASIAGYYIYQRLHPVNTNTLSVSGNLELTQVDISFKVPGKLIELNVDEGVYVKKGQVIARIDKDQVQQQRTRDQASLAGSESQYQQTLTSVQWQRQTLESDIALRKAEIRAAQAQLDQLVAGSRPRRFNRRAPPSPMPKHSTIKRRPIGIAHRIFSSKTTSRNSSTINTACGWTAPPRVCSKPTKSSR